MAWRRKGAPKRGVKGIDTRAYFPGGWVFAVRMGWRSGGDRARVGKVGSLLRTWIGFGATSVVEPKKECRFERFRCQVSKIKIFWSHSKTLLGKKPQKIDYRLQKLINSFSLIKNVLFWTCLGGKTLIFEPFGYRRFAPNYFVARRRFAPTSFPQIRISSFSVILRIN